MTPRHDPCDDPSVPALIVVLPLGVEMGTVAGHRLVLLALEVWDGWADLRFARVDVGAERPLARRVPPPAAWRVTADGQPLEVVDAVGRGDRAFSNGEVRLRPAPRAGATLEVEVELAPGEQPLTATVPLPSWHDPARRTH